MSEARGPHILGLVPVVGRESLAYLPFKGSSLVSCAVRALYPVAEHVIVMTDDGQAEQARGEVARLLADVRAGSPGARIGAQAAVDVIEGPRQDPRATTAAANADVVVVHDPLCPAVSTESLNRLARLWVPGTVTVAVRPVVDTIKVAKDGVVTGTLDRESLRAIASPVVLAADRVAAMSGLGQKLADLAALVTELRGVSEVVLTPAGSGSGRVEDPSSLALLAALDAAHDG